MDEKMTRDQYEALRRKIEQPPPQWMAQLDERTNKHIVFARNYAESYAHGAPGYLDLMTIAALANFLDNYEDHGTPWPERQGQPTNFG